MNSLLKKCYLNELDFDNGLVWNMDAKITKNDSQTTISLINKDFIKDKIYRERYSYCFLSNKEDATLDFNTRFQIFKLKNQGDVDRMASAFYAEYNPIDNFDKKEEITENNTTENTIVGKVKDSETTESNSNSNNTKSGNIVETGNDTQLPYDNVTVNSVSPENNNEYYNKDKSENQIGQMQTNSSFETTYNSVKDVTQGQASNVKESSKSWENYKDTNTETRALHSHVHGNVGTTRTQTMIADELSLRIRTLADYIMDKFLDENTFYVSEMD